MKTPVQATNIASRCSTAVGCYPLNPGKHKSRKLNQTDRNNTQWDEAAKSAELPHTTCSPFIQ